MRRFTRYSIRSLLVLVTLMCVVLGWYATQVNAYREDQAALLEIERINGLLQVEIDGKFTTSRPPAFCNTNIVGRAKLERVSPFGVHRVLGRYGDVFLRVRELDLSGGFYIGKLQIDQRVVHELPRLRHLTILSVEGRGLEQPTRDRILSSLPNTKVEFYDFWASPQPKNRSLPPVPRPDFSDLFNKASEETRPSGRNSLDEPASSSELKMNVRAP